MLNLETNQFQVHAHYVIPAAALALENSMFDSSVLCTGTGDRLFKWSGFTYCSTYLFSPYDGSC